MLRRYFTITLCLLFISAATACGKTGKLYLPDDKTDKAETSSKAVK